MYEGGVLDMGVGIHGGLEELLPRRHFSGEALTAKSSLDFPQNLKCYFYEYNLKILGFFFQFILVSIYYILH